ncbi:N-acetylglucosamine-specific PTS transporter subunit IIBC [Levilactobacillus bambusae]|uniref:PTS N-acetylglucosamine transporter subunit IIABC n=1 Tax=Levilactobacillus bambusae TaxID=2024736 RepID=A0A2V1N228_9LACO|nr:N-acetylglucosamine-specific PTS transporter subunit IIBC [Levilactobacillus bambusae]PWG00280.1 PTS N-acetylglucosamine transporter subunit IIABC [Levilactobacillus bambusae]
MKTYLQRMGRSLMLPVATLPAAALLMGIGHALPSTWAFALFLQAGANAILGNLPTLFAVGLALGMSVDKSGAAALAGLVALLVPMFVLDPVQVATYYHTTVANVDPAFTAIKSNVLIGIIAGLIAAGLYNKFHEVKLPMALSFFSGKRLVPILASIVMLALSAILLFAWPPVYEALVAFGKFMVGLGALGAGLYGFFNRLLIPTGLHQALNSVFWFNVAGINDIGNFWSGHGTKGVTGMYQAGFYPIMMFGLPAGAYAIYKNALPERKKETASLMLGAGVASFFTGVTEPLEFSFMFVAWPLYLLHAIFTGLSMAFAAAMHWIAGFAFSAGLVDYVLSFHLPLADKPYMLLVQGLVMAAIYYFGFDFAIKKFNLMTPGREPVEADDGDGAIELQNSENDDKYMTKAKKIYIAIGGKDNISLVDSCATRLRLQLKDTGKINEKALKKAGVAGVNTVDKTNLQVIIGTDVQFVDEALAKLYNAGVPLSDLTISTDNPAKEDEKLDAEAIGEKPAVTTDLHSVANGQFVNITDVADDTFAQKMIGDGFAIEPSDNTIVSPIDGTVTVVFPTKHAIGLKTDSGLEVLVHMGLDTVELNGKPFDVQVKANDQVHHGDVLATMDLDQVKSAGKQTTVEVVVTNMDQVSDLHLDIDGDVTQDQTVGSVTTK